MKIVSILVLLSASVSLAQSDFSPPPMVPVPDAASTLPPPPPSPPVVVPQQPGTPPPPQTVPSSTYVPGQQGSQTGYQYSAFNNAKQEKPSPEIGLMVSESLFGMLTAAGVTVLPYFLLFNNGALSGGGDNTVASILFCLIFSAAPLTVAQTQVGLANGSRFYNSETWPAALAGLGAQAAILGIFYATGWLPTGQVSGGVPNGGSVPFLLIGSIGLVPLIQMAVINLTKQPKFNFAALNVNSSGKVALGLPTPSPILTSSSAGLSMGINFSLFKGTF